MKLSKKSFGFVLALALLWTARATGDSLNCRLVGNWPFGPARAVALDSSRHLAFCGSGGGVFVLDVSDPALPVKLSEISTSGVVKGLCYLTNLLYVAGDFAGLRVISVVDPAHPLEVGYYDTLDYAEGVAVVGDYAYLLEGYAGLRVISVVDPAHPVEVGCCDVPDEHWSVAVVGDYAYVAAGHAGLRVISVADPAHPAEVGHCITPTYARGVAVVGDYAYVADYRAGLQIYQFYGAGVEETPNAEVRSTNAIPTVVRGVLELAVDSRQHTAYRAELLDATGRRVAELHPGPNDVSRFGVGVYFIRIRTLAEGPVAVSRIVLVR
jgi:hypothetical protein